MACQRGWRASVGYVPAWVTWVMRQCGWSRRCTNVGVVGGILKWVALVILEEIPWWCVRHYRGWCIISQTLPKTRRKWILFKVRKRIQVSAHIHSEYILLLGSPSDIWILTYFQVASRTESKLWHNQNPRSIKNSFNIPCETLEY